MDFIPTYICPGCGKKMNISGRECPHCHKSFSAKEVDAMFVVCPSCLSDSIEIVFVGKDNAPRFGVAFDKSRYSAIIGLIQKHNIPGLHPVFVCQKCGKKFDSRTFCLTTSLIPDRQVKVRKQSESGILDMAIIILGILVFAAVVVAVFF